MFTKMSFLLLVGAVSLFSCTEKGTSKPSYKFLKVSKEGVAAKIGSIEISHKELNEGIENDLYELENKIFETKMGKIKALLLEKLMKNDPNKKGLTNDEYMEKYIAKGVKISKKEIDSFIKERKIPKEQVNPQIKQRIEDFLMTEKKKAAVEDWIAKKTKKSGVEIYIEKPRRPTFNVEVGNSPQTNSKAKVTIVEFSDFQCPYCSRAAETVNEIKKKYGAKVNVVFKQYPLPFHSQAKLAANAALCANEQNTKYFWKMHDAMFANQSELGKDQLIAKAKKMGIKEGEFKTCMDNQKYFPQIEKDIEQGKKLSVKSTPTFFVNGMLVMGAQPIEVFSEIIDSELNQ